MIKLNIAKIATLTLICVSSLFAEIVVEKEVIETPAKEEVVQPVPAKEEVTQPAPEKEEVVEPVPAKEEVAQPAPVKKKIILNTPPKPSASDVVIMMPKVPEVPKVNVIVPKLILLDCDGKLITEDSMDKFCPPKEKHIFSDRVAPARFNKSKNNKKVEILAGDIDNGRVTAYLHIPLMSVDEAKEKLKSAGFEILSTFKVDKKGTATSIVFTNEDIKKAASKKTRGFAGTLRITVDTENSLVVISNPIYLMRAFMQKEYDEKLAEATLKKLRGAFPDAKNSQEIVKFSILERYHFMENMPYYKDVQTIAQGKNKELLKKAKESKKVVYEQHLENGSIIIGVKLGKRTSKFVKKIGYQNSGLLPYPVLIENGKAVILAPQYYIAVMYPMLKMSEFMKIATVPGAIGKDIDKIFR